jgi:hypothetical protein
MKILLGISGASGAVYGVRAGAALAAGVELHILVTKIAWEIAAGELAGTPPPPSHSARKQWIARLLLRFPGSAACTPRTISAYRSLPDRIPPMRSSSHPARWGMLGRIAHGVSTSVLERCADVALKEKKPLVLVPARRLFPPSTWRTCWPCPAPGRDPARLPGILPPSRLRGGPGRFRGLPHSLPGGAEPLSIPGGGGGGSGGRSGKNQMRRAEPLRGSAATGSGGVR